MASEKKEEKEKRSRGEDVFDLVFTGELLSCLINDFLCATENKVAHWELCAVL